MRYPFGSDGRSVAELPDALSLEDQHCERQLRELREYCGSHNWTISREYVDTDWGSSRPELDRLRKDAARHGFDVVLVWKLDRVPKIMLVENFR